MPEENETPEFDYVKELVSETQIAAHLFKWRKRWYRVSIAKGWFAKRPVQCVIHESIRTGRVRNWKNELYASKGNLDPVQNFQIYVNTVKTQESEAVFTDI